MTNQKPRKRTQRTPKGLEIPVPKRKDFNAVLDKVAKAPKRSVTRRPNK